MGQRCQGGHERVGRCRGQDTGDSGRSQGIKAVEGAVKSVGGKNQEMTSGETEGTGSHRKK